LTATGAPATGADVGPAASAGAGAGAAAGESLDPPPHAAIYQPATTNHRPNSAT